MKKITSNEKGAEIRFRATGNEGGSGAVYLITNDGILASDEHAQIMSDRLGSQITVAEPDKKAIAAAQAAEAAAAAQAALKEGAACKTEDGEDGTLQMVDGKLKCVVEAD
jgi:hypothetical protein